jgi:hypothetical protein
MGPYGKNLPEPMVKFYHIIYNIINKYNKYTIARGAKDFYHLKREDLRRRKRIGTPRRRRVLIPRNI